MWKVPIMNDDIDDKINPLNGVGLYSRMWLKRLNGDLVNTVITEVLGNSANRYRS